MFEEEKEIKGAPDGGKREIIELGETSVESEAGRIRCMTIIGQIEGHYAQQQGSKTHKIRAYSSDDSGGRGKP